MKAVGEKVEKLLKNAWGQYSGVIDQEFEVEERDIGVVRHRLNGSDTQKHVFNRADVGKRIIVRKYPDNYQGCWFWR